VLPPDRVFWSAARAAAKPVSWLAPSWSAAIPPLSVWFWAVYLIASQTPGMSAVQFRQPLGLTRFETAFGILHKLRAGMVRPDQDRIGGRLSEHVEVDETWVGGRTRGEGRGIHHKTLVTAAVEVRHRKPGSAQDKRKDGRYAGRVRPAIAANRSADSLCGFVESAVMPGSLIVTDDWSGYAGLRKWGCDHHSIAEGGAPEVAEQFMPMIRLVFSNLKTWLNGIHHGVSAKHLQACLNEFTFRFNRRFYPFNAFRSLLGIAGRVEAPTYDELYSGDWRHPTCRGGCLDRIGKPRTMAPFLRLRHRIRERVRVTLGEWDAGAENHRRPHCRTRAEGR